MKRNIRCFWISAARSWQWTGWTARVSWWRWKTMGETMTIALLGQPNSGKSTFYNSLTGSHQHVGNWPGKTVERNSGTFRYKGNGLCGILRTVGARWKGKRDSGHRKFVRAVYGGIWHSISEYHGAAAGRQGITFRERPVPGRESDRAGDHVIRVPLANLYCVAGLHDGEGRRPGRPVLLSQQLEQSGDKPGFYFPLSPT